MPYFTWPALLFIGELVFKVIMIAVILLQRKKTPSTKLAWILLIVVKAAGANLPLVRIPNLHLRRTAQIDAAVTTVVDFPIHIHLKIGVVFLGAEALPAASEN